MFQTGEQSWLFSLIPLFTNPYYYSHTVSLASLVPSWEVEPGNEAKFSFT